MNLPAEPAQPRWTFLRQWLKNPLRTAAVLPSSAELGAAMVAELPRPESFSWPVWILCVVSLMFLLPAVLLGTTSPLVASMALARSTRLGMTVGNVYAWGALGSIVGTFLTGFYLIDVWGTRSIVGLTAGTLAVLAVVVKRPDYDGDPTDEIKALVKERKGSVQAPKQVVFAEAIPLTGLGKPDKKALRAPYWEGRERSV